jgi:hypothetical protein
MPHLPGIDKAIHAVLDSTSLHLSTIMATRSYQGHCHCGQYRYKIDVPEITSARSCSCEICRKIGYLTATVPKECFGVTRSSEPLVTYSYGSGTHQV